jgi:hypothetical protein
MLGIRVLDLQKGSPAPHASVVTEALGSGGAGRGRFQHRRRSAIPSSRAPSRSALSGCRSWLTAHAHLVIPDSPSPRRTDSLLILRDTQQLKPVWRPKRKPSGASPISDRVVARTKPHEFVTQIRKAIQDTVPAFAGVNLTKLGPTGVRANAQAVAS